jgi:hypothetical protein
MRLPSLRRRRCAREVGNLPCPMSRNPLEIRASGQSLPRQLFNADRHLARHLPTLDARAERMLAVLPTAQCRSRVAQCLHTHVW